MTGGEFTFVRDWARAASRSAHVTLTTPEPKQSLRRTPGPLVDDTRWGSTMALPWVALRPSRVFLPFHAAWGATVMQRALRSLAGRSRPVDCIHTHFFSGCAGILRAAERLSVPLIHTEHSSAILGQKISLQGRRLLLHVCRQAHTVFAVSQPLADAMYAYGVERPIEVLHNPVDVLAFADAPVTAPYSRDVGPCFVTIGWLLPAKGHDILLRAFSLASRELPCASLDIVGSGVLESSLRDLAGTLGVAGRVRFLGRLSREQVVSVLASSHVYVHTSRSETFGVALVEAWASGLPVVTFDCGGVSGLAGEMGGEVVPTRAAEALAAAMVRQASSVSLEQRATIRHRASQRFDPAHVSRRLEQSYRAAVLDSSGHPPLGSRREPGSGS